jgi:hypothetical protein
MCTGTSLVVSCARPESSAIQRTANTRPASTKPSGRGSENVNHGRGWEYCGSEGGFCSFSGPGEVRYGINGKFVVRRAINGIPCALSAFGRDPAYGENKQCFVKLSPR